jgi:serine phosphatase RsbU (regulator of sigma subunit)
MEFSMHKGDIYYILSDGYIDQFGGDKGKKFMTKRFKELLLEIYDKPMETQKEILWNTIVEWRGDIEQIDDIIIIGIKVV